MRYTLFLAILWTLLSFGSFAQGQEENKAKARLSELSRHFEGAERLYAKMRVMGLRESDSLPYYDHTAEVRFSGNNFWNRFNGSETMVCDGLIFQARTDMKQLLCRVRTPLEARKARQGAQLLQNMDKILKQYKTLRHTEDKKDNVEIFVFGEGQGHIKEMELHIGKKDHKPKEMVYRYDPKRFGNGNKVRIVFEVFDSQSPVDSNYFRPERYLSSDKGKIKPKGEFGELRFHCPDKNAMAKLKNVLGR
ncbi:hypothetical protein FUAX_53000 (plasmid) [Fulvitalea axinellae]|uniref:DUF1571 domain-containing protein n=1 Tax=Fulvitalea axinellae TaxID=1182444 RepID=A0AAU9CRT6_9BACT|nr:hypothetical protein FUAX_53000 [Fulvitalea axinellae]